MRSRCARKHRACEIPAFDELHLFPAGPIRTDADSVAFTGIARYKGTQFRVQWYHPMKDQVHIRNAEAAQLARTLARSTGKPISQVVLEALRNYRPRQSGPVSKRRIAHWQRLLREDRQQGMARPATPIEALYDDVTGLPR